MSCRHAVKIWRIFSWRSSLWGQEKHWSAQDCGAADGSVGLSVSTIIRALEAEPSSCSSPSHRHHSHEIQEKCIAGPGSGTTKAGISISRSLTVRHRIFILVSKKLFKSALRSWAKYPSLGCGVWYKWGNLSKLYWCNWNQFVFDLVNKPKACIGICISEG